MSRFKECPNCGRLNDPQNEFCDGCKQRLTGKDVGVDKRGRVLSRFLGLRINIKGIANKIWTGLNFVGSSSWKLIRFVGLALLSGIIFIARIVNVFRYLYYYLQILANWLLRGLSIIKRKTAIVEKQIEIVYEEQWEGLRRVPDPEALDNSDQKTEEKLEEEEEKTKIAIEEYGSGRRQISSKKRFFYMIFPIILAVIIAYSVYHLFA